MIISFKPGEITDPHIAHEVATKIADAKLKDKHEYVLSTHVDKDHVHWMIVKHHDRGSIRKKGHLQHFSRMYERLIEAAHTYDCQRL